MDCTYLCAGWRRRRNVHLYCWKKFDKRKQQPWIVAVYWSLERQFFCKYLNNIQCDGPAVRCRFWLLQCKIYIKYVNNQQREGRAVNDKTNKTAVVKYSMNHTYLCVSWRRIRNVRPYYWKQFDKRKQQTWLVAVYWYLERKMYYNYWNNIQCEGPEVRCSFWSLQQNIYAKYVNNQQREGLAVNDKINKTAVVKSSTNCTYLCVSWWRRRNVRPYFWKNVIKENNNCE